MILDFQEPTVEPEHTADVCIVGAGPAGLAIASSFLGTSTSVLVVESGGFGTDPAVDRLKEGHTAGMPLGISEGRARTFGGTGTVWPGQLRTLDPWDLAARDWVPDSGWPIDPQELDAYYARAGEWFGVPRKAFDGQPWLNYGLRPPPFDDERLVHKSSAYTPHPDVGAHLRRRFERSGNVRVLLNATAARIGTDEGGRTAREVEIRSMTGRSGRISARTVVLCGGGIENARLLLLSGFGGRSGTVGRFFHEHPTFWVDVDLEGWADQQRFYGRTGRGKVRHAARICLAPQVQEQERVLNASAVVVFVPRISAGLAAAREISSALQERRRPQGIGAAEARAALGEWQRVARTALDRFARGRPSAGPLAGTRLKILLEQAPHPDSRITLSAQLDDLGLPTACVDWRLTELERRTARVMVETLDAEFHRLGLGRTTGPGWLDDDDWTSRFEDAYHPMGATRMSDDPATGVVDGDCRVHGVRGLYVCGSSVFPTGGHANPTLTIVALALRLADHLRSNGGRRSWT